MQMKRTVLVLLSFALALGAGVAAQRPPAWAPQADAIFADVADPGAAGCAMAVYRDGRIAYERGYGIADLEHDVPITPASVFYVGSLSKQFTAFAVALAASEGKLSIDDDVRKWLPELPDYGTRLDVGHLLHHTSGLRDYNTLFDIAGRRNDEAFDNQIVLGIIARQRALNFPPGEQYLYSNSGYVLLSHIVERATGTPLAAYAKTRMFEPLGMRDTQFYDDVTRVVKNRAFAYERTAAGGVRDNTPHSQRTGAGGVLTTVRDLLAWDNNFYEPKVGTKALIAAMQQPGALKSGKPLTYAYGADRQIPRVADRGARRIARWLPRASDPVSGGAYVGRLPVQLRHERSGRPRTPRCRRTTARPLHIGRTVSHRGRCAGRAGRWQRGEADGGADPPVRRPLRQ